MKKLLSIVIPIYNVEKYIGRLFDSFICQKQHLFGYEIIAVDDGTPDESMKVVEQYKRRLPITILHQDNKGLSGARNTGLKAAEGEYVWFVDSDDTIADGIFEKLNPILNGPECDMFGFCVRHVFENGNSFLESPCCNKKRRDVFVGKIKKGTEIGISMACGIAQRYIFRRGFLSSSNLWFKEGIIFEDVELLVKVRCLAQTILLTDIVSYNYLRRGCGSIMSSQDMRSANSLVSILNGWDEFRDKYKWYDVQNSIICGGSFELVCQVLSLHRKISDKEYLFFYKQKRWLLTKKGIYYFIHGFRHIRIKHYINLIILLINPKGVIN